LPQAARRPTESPSAPPVDTSRTDATIILPAVRAKNDKRPLVIGVIAALLVLLAVGLLIRPKPITEPAAAFAPNTATKPAEAAEAANAAAPTAPSAEPAAAASDKSPVTAPSAPPIGADSASAKKQTAPTSKPQPIAKPAPAGAKSRPGFDPSKPWEED
jgi:cytoskeletal protein RodZ